MAAVADFVFSLVHAATMSPEVTRSSVCYLFSETIEMGSRSGGHVHPVPMTRTVSHATRRDNENTYTGRGQETSPRAVQ